MTNQLLTIDQLPDDDRDLYVVEYSDGVETGIGTANEVRTLAADGLFNVPATELRFRLEWAA